MADLETIRVQLDYPLNVVKQPIIYHLVMDYRLIPDIRRANIDAHIGGMLALEIRGTRADIDAGLEYLRGLGITVAVVGTEAYWAV